MKSLLEKIDKQIYWQKNIGDYPCFTLNELKQIKQDLEVLKIIKNRNVNLFKLKRVFTNLEDIDDVLLAYNACSFRNEQITLEELLKLKQWLEENENDN